MKTHWLVLLLLTFGPACHADRDIVYAARYYAPPSSHRTSHFHVYRINPNGTGKTQLTFGTADDRDPRWSPDGRYITFSEYNRVLKLETLCKIDANGYRRRVLKTGASADSSWPPILTVTGYRLEDDSADRYDLPDKYVLINLKTGHRLTLKVPVHEEPSDELLPMPGNGLVYEFVNHNTEFERVYLYYRLNLKTGMLHYLTDGQFLAWSPECSHFCTVPGLNTTPYERRKPPYKAWKDATAQELSNAEYVKVWFAPLYIRATTGGPMRQLTPRLSWVTGADWRVSKR